MSISVISASATGAANALSAPGTTGGDTTGEFAALLSGELGNLLGLIPAVTGTAPAEVDADKPAVVPEEAEESLTVVDPALLASLMGNSQFQPEITSRGNATFQPGTDQTGKSIAGNVLSLLEGKADARLPGLEASLDAAKTAAATLEKAALAGNAATEAATTLANEAANIAVEASRAESSAASGAANPLLAAAAARQSSEARANQQPEVSTHLRDAAWPQQFGEKLVWLTKNDQQSAQININPPQLGPVQITISLSGDQASLAFASPHAEVRQAIESAMPQLKEMLSASGINLGQANVGGNLNQQTPDNPFQSPNGNRSTSENAILPASENAAGTGVSAALNRGRGMVDLFA